MLTDENRKKIKLRDFLQIQNFIKGIMILPQNNEETLHLLATSTISAKPSKMNIVSLIKPLLISLNEADIPVCVIGEVVLNYYNVPRVVHVSLRYHDTAKGLYFSHVW